MDPSSLRPIVTTVIVGLFLATARAAPEDEVRFNYLDADQCTVSHDVTSALGIRIERDLRVMWDITYRSPRAVPESELLEEYERLLHANRLDFVRLEPDRYVIVPAGVTKPIAPEDPCAIMSERRWDKELRLRWKARCRGVPLPVVACVARRGPRLRCVSRIGCGASG